MKFGEYNFMKKILVLSFVLIALGRLVAQDRQFTQFYASPLTLNPALSGLFDGKYRVGTVYRDQWRGLLEQPYQTFSFGADLRLEPFRVSKDKVGTGLVFFRDKINALDFSTTQIAISGAYHKSLNPESSQYLSMGVQVGLTQRNVNYETLTFQDQWNGVTGYSLPSAERLPENNFGYNDLSTGINYTAQFENKTSVFVGGSFYHFNRPNVSFYKGDDLPKIKLFPRYSAQLAMNFPINKAHTIFMSPRLVATLQGPHMTANAGTNFKVTIDKALGTSLHIGSWLRPVKNETGFNLDAVVMMAGLEYNNIMVGVSYDLNLPTLKNYRRSQNVFEISLIYLGEYDNDELLCPTF